MMFYINAWLNRSNPFISICDRNNDEELMRFEQQELQKYITTGDLCLSDFCISSPHEQQMLVKELLLLRCCRVLRTDINELSCQLKKRRPKVLPFSAQSKQNSAQNDAQWAIGSRPQTHLNSL